MELLTQTDFAKRIKKSQPYINKLIKAGKIPLHQKKINPKEAIAILKSTAMPGKDPQRQFNKEQKGKGAKKAALDRAAGKTERVDSIDPEIIGTSKAMQKARLLKEINLAKIQEVEYKKAVGELLPVEVVKRENAKIAEVVRGKLLSLPTRVAPRVLGLKTIPDVQDLLQREINNILDEFINLSKTIQSNYEIK